MWTSVKNNSKTFLVTITILIISIPLAFLLEDYYRQFVRFLFKLFNGNHIQFFGKNFHLLASNSFVIAFALFTVAVFLLLKFYCRHHRLKRTCFTVFVFFATTILITALESKRLIVECTACNDGVRRLTYNEITYDQYFILSLAAAIIYLLTTCFLDHQRTKYPNPSNH